MKNYKIETYLPMENVPAMINALRSCIANQIGNYRNCFSWYPVSSAWTSLENASPYIGTPGTISNASEMKIEFLCHENKVSEVIDVIRTNHPYEEPVINILPMYTAYDWKENRN